MLVAGRCEELKTTKDPSKLEQAGNKIVLALGFVNHPLGLRQELMEPLHRNLV